MTTLRNALTGLALLLSSAAGAADLRGGIALPPAPELPALYDWSGFYVGLQAGYGWGSSRVRIGGASGPFAPMSFRIDDNLGFGGAHAGLNYQMGSLVVGIDGDVEVLDSSGRFIAGGLTGRVTQDWQGAVRARIGYAFDRLMVYGAGGVSFTEYERRVYDGAGLSERLTSAHGLEHRRRHQLRADRERDPRRGISLHRFRPQPLRELGRLHRPHRQPGAGDAIRPRQHRLQVLSLQKPVRWRIAAASVPSSR